MTNIQKTVSPIDGTVFVERPLATPTKIASTIAAATEAQREWAATTITERQAICRAAVRAFTATSDPIAEELCWQMGRPIRFAAGEVRGFEERATYMIDIAEASLAAIQPGNSVDIRRYIKRVPIGVVLVIAPWNYPYLTAVNAVIPALLAGNAVILKHSAQTPLCSERMVEAFTSVGLPEAVFQFLHMSHDATATVIRAPEIGYVSFTGSVYGGTAIETAAAGRFIGVGLELGGKDPTYIRADANLDLAVESIVNGAYFNSGQSCCGIERAYVHTSVFDEVRSRMTAAIGQYKLGNPTDPSVTLGPMVNSRAAAVVRKQTEDAISAGAKACIDPATFGADKSGTPYVAPQLLVNVRSDMRVMREETFGPLLGLQAVASDLEAIQLMNDSEYGLTASVFSSDIETAETIADDLEAGTVFVNRCDYLDPALAWTGVRNSGRGCSLSVLGYGPLTRPKSFHIRTGP